LCLRRYHKRRVVECLPERVFLAAFLPNTKYLLGYLTQCPISARRLSDHICGVGRLYFEPIHLLPSNLPCYPVRIATWADVVVTHILIVDNRTLCAHKLDKIHETNSWADERSTPRSPGSRGTWRRWASRASCPTARRAAAPATAKAAEVQL